MHKQNQPMSLGCSKKRHSPNQATITYELSKNKAMQDSGTLIAKTSNAIEMENVVVHAKTCLLNKQSQNI